MAEKAERKELTLRQMQLAEAVARPENHSIAAAGRAIGMHRSNASRMMTYDGVKDEVGLRRQERSDNARGFMSNLDVFGQKLSKAIARLDPTVLCLGCAGSGWVTKKGVG